jgi:hypothetical protein
MRAKDLDLYPHLDLLRERNFQSKRSSSMLREAQVEAS